MVGKVRDDEARAVVRFGGAGTGRGDRRDELELGANGGGVRCGWRTREGESGGGRGRV